MARSYSAQDNEFYDELRTSSYADGQGLEYGRPTAKNVRVY